MQRLQPLQSLHWIHAEFSVAALLVSSRAPSLLLNCAAVMTFAIACGNPSNQRAAVLVEERVVELHDSGADGSSQRSGRLARGELVCVLFQAP